jgi:DNA-directed RNA polymerase specialized sigma54-like protein
LWISDWGKGLARLFIMAGTSLAEHLRAQLRTRNAPPDVGRIAERIIENLDEYGYLPVRLEELAADDAGQQELARQSLALVQEGLGRRGSRGCSR